MAIRIMAVVLEVRRNMCVKSIRSAPRVNGDRPDAGSGGAARFDPLRRTPPSGGRRHPRDCARNSSTSIFDTIATMWFWSTTTPT